MIIAAASRLSCINDQLVYRFHVLAVPPLQKFDIPELAEYFLGTPLKDEVSDLLVSRQYPGNVRELRKFCERLEIERGKSLFSDSRRRRSHADHPFDYKRFYDEFLLWHEYLAPIIDKFKLDIRYAYQQGSKEYESQPGQIIEVMKMLRHGCEDVGNAGVFDRLLRSHIINQELSNLLGEIYTQCKAPIPQNIRGRIDVELPKLTMRAHGYQGDQVDEIPTGGEDHEMPGQLQELFGLPIREARNKFIKLYLENALRKSENDLKEATKMTRLTKKGLESAMRRYGIKIHSSE